MTHYLVASTTIVVSGYPPFPAMVLQTNGTGLPAMDLVRCVSVADLAQYQARLERLLRGRGPGTRARCPRCRRWDSRENLADERLGFPGYCPACVALFTVECLKRHGRYPRTGEFYCLSCRAMRPAEAFPPPDADGRRRWRCRICRAAQVARADHRRRLRQLPSIANPSPVRGGVGSGGGGPYFRDADE